MKVITVLGTRPELIKLSEIIKKLDRYTDHTFVHTGQNYDYELDGIFYDDLDLRKPDINLEAITVPDILKYIEICLKEMEPDAVVILGDTNSALSAYVAKRMKIPVFHLEAGNRCFDDNVPEEINRRVVDHISDVNLVYTEHARRNLLAEGIAGDRIFTMGSPMWEVLDRLELSTEIFRELGIEPRKYFVTSIHREENVDNKNNITNLINALNRVAATGYPTILSAHPRLLHRISTMKLHRSLIVHKPFGLRDYITLQSHAKCVLSDSGTLAEESNILDFPAVSLRNCTERPEAVDVGGLLVSGVTPDNILDCIKLATDDTEDRQLPDGYDVMNVSDRVLKVILSYTDYVNRKVYK